MLDLHRLKLLREVDARGTVHGAARALDYTPSAIPNNSQCLNGRPERNCLSALVATYD